MKSFLIILPFIISSTLSFAENKKACNPTQQATVSVVKESSDDGRFLTARVSYKGSPVRNVSVNFQSPRLFGILSHGEAITDHEGVAKLPFPENFPGNSQNGDFSVTAKVVKSETYLGESTITVDGGKALKVVENPFPREIWSPNTDWYLLLTIPFLILCVWSVYVFSIAQLVKLSRMSRQD